MKYFHDRYWRKKKSPTEDYVYKVGLIKKLVPLKKDLHILDFGCGKGDITKAVLSVNPSLKLTGVDVSEVAVATAKKKNPNQRFSTIVEGKTLPFKNNSFDFIMALDVFNLVYDTEFTFKELTRVLSNNGKVLITVPYFGLLKNILVALLGFEQVYFPRSPVIRFYTKHGLVKEISAVGLSIVTFGYFGRFYPFSRGMYCICEKSKDRS